MSAPGVEPMTAADECYHRRVSSDDEGQTREQRQVPRPRASDRCRLVIVGDASATVFELPPGGEVVIGRDEACALRIADESVSRRHARILVAAGGVEAEDFGSRNGTLLNGQPLTARRALESGDILTIGEVAVLFRRERAREARAQALSEAELRERVEQEVERALRFGRSFALVALSAPSLRTDAVLACARRIDLVAGGEGVVWLLLPETDAHTDAGPASMFAALSVPQVRGGFALCPDDACDAPSLFASAREAMAAAEAGKLRAANEGVVTHTFDGRDVVLADPAMLRIYALLRRVAVSDLPVLLTGESGTGKDLAALALHHWSRRASAPLVVLNCAALPDSLVESELFGYEKGAFSGAAQAKPGRLESAQGGTVFLDEVGELTAATQAKLLRVLEAKRITRLGDTRERAVDIRLVAATNRDLEAEVQKGTFRRDLYFRLSAAKVALPPLRERPRELPVLARRFLDEACARLGFPGRQWSAAALRRLSAHAWPGNVRELKNVVEYLAAGALGD